MTKFAWQPTSEYIEAANVTRLMRSHGIGSLAELRRRSVQDIGWYWDAVVKDLGIPFRKPYERVLDDADGIAWTRWFIGGHSNIAHGCVDRWRDDPTARDRLALVAEVGQDTPFPGRCYQVPTQPRTNQPETVLRHHKSWPLPRPPAGSRRHGSGL